MLVAIHAVPFGLGPATIALSIAEELLALAPKLKEPLALVGLGRDSVLEEFADSGLFSSLIEVRVSSFDKPQFELVHKRTATPCRFLLVGDFLLARKLAQFGHRPFFVDFLRPILGPAPVSSDQLRLRFVPSLPSGYGHGASPAPGEFFVPPIWRSGRIAAATPTTVGPLVINLGGLRNPFGDCLPGATALVRALVRGVREATPDIPVLVCSGDSRLEHALGSEVRASPFLSVARLSHHEFLREAGRARAIFTVPGLSSVLELLALKKVFCLLPGLNYSHHLQGARYLDAWPDLSVMEWSEIPGYAKLEPGLSDEEGCSQAFALGERLAQDPVAALSLAQSAAKALMRLLRSEPLPVGPDKSGACIVAEALLEAG